MATMQPQGDYDVAEELDVVEIVQLILLDLLPY
jgi:hypothetical protein